MSNLKSLCQRKMFHNLLYFPCNKGKGMHTLAFEELTRKLHALNPAFNMMVFDDM